MLHRAATHLSQNLVSTFHPPTCPARGWIRFTALGPGEVSEECGRTAEPSVPGVSLGVGDV